MVKCEMCHKRKAVAWLNKKQVCSKCFDIHKIGGVKENTIPKWLKENTIPKLFVVTKK